MSIKNQSKGILLESGTNEVEFLVVCLGQQLYGVNVSKITTIQVFDPSSVVSLPHQQQAVLGLMPFRDETISIIDLSVYLKGAAEQQNKRLLVVSEFNQRRTGLVVDGVDRIERCSWKQFEPMSDISCNKESGNILGTVRLNDKLILIIDLETMLANLDSSMSMESYAVNAESEICDRSKVNIAHCDDSMLIQKLINKVLKQAGFSSITQFNNGEELLKYLQSPGRENIDIVLSDIEMPKMDGLTLCKHIRSDQQLSKIPVVFFSSIINEQMQAKCKSVGGNLSYSKPEINLIVKGIEEILSAK